MGAVKIVHRGVFIIAFFAHVVAIVVLVFMIVERENDELWHLPYFAIMLCAIWASVALVLALRSKRSLQLLNNNIIPAAVMFPCSFGLLILGLPSVGFSFLSGVASMLFSTVPYAVWLSTAVNTFWCGGFVLYYYGMGFTHLGQSMIVVALIVNVANMLVKKLIEEAAMCDRLLNQARWSAARLPAITMSLDYEIQRNRRDAANEERSRLAQLLHDSTGYALTATVVQLNTLRELTQEPDLRNRIMLLENLVRETNQDVKKQVSDLRDMQTPVEEVDWCRQWVRLCSVFNDCTGMSVNTDMDDMSAYIDGELGETIYRVIQESLTNAYRHGHATVVSVAVKTDDRADLIMIKISDNGQGADKFTLGNGLKGMISRMNRYGGSVSWDTRPGKGFDLGIDLPIRRGA